MWTNQFTNHNQNVIFKSLLQKLHINLLKLSCNHFVRIIGKIMLVLYTIVRSTKAKNFRGKVYWRKGGQLNQNEYHCKSCFGKFLNCSACLLIYGYFLNDVTIDMKAISLCGNDLESNGRISLCTFGNFQTKLLQDFLQMSRIFQHVA